MSIEIPYIEEFNERKAKKLQERYFKGKQWTEDELKKIEEEVNEEMKLEGINEFSTAQYINSTPKERLKLIKQKEMKENSKIFTKEGQIEEYYSKNPFFYTKNKMFYVWNEDLHKYELSDEIDMLNQISQSLGIDTINSRTKTELIAGFQQIGRKKIPKEAPLSWVQFKNKICDFKTGDIFEASPEYYLTNPLPWEIGKDESTPTIDALFTEWVGKDYKLTLEQIASYCVSSEQFMQRLIALVGGGSNGKGTFIKFIKRLLGAENMASSELKELSENQFETASIYKKLACVMGEISYEDLKNTNQIKKLAGEDDIRFCFKGKTPFSEKSITTLIVATNSLPRTPDKTMGFYRKFLIVDFPNQFTEIKQGLIEKIPEVEFKNFCKRILRVLKELYQNQKFENEGNFQERMDRYEERSNPILKFIESNCSETVGENVELKVFTNIFNSYAKEHHCRIMSVRQVSKILNEEGFEHGKRAIITEEGTKTSKQYILNLKINTNNTENTDISSQIPCEKMSSNFGISGIIGISSLTKEELKLLEGLTKEDLEGVL